MSWTSDIVGHAQVIAQIDAARAANRLPHGLVFAGPAGVGKGTLAAALAADFLGDANLDASPDYHVVRRELIRYHDKTGKSKGTVMGVDVIREELVKPAALSSVGGRGKVFVVEEAETMSPQAQNALLKTLEEPSGRTLIVLLTRDARDLLPTIRSRCQTLTFGPLSADDATTVLERSGLTGDDARDAAKLAGGSPGLALRYHADGIVPRAKQMFTLLKSAPHDLPTFLADAGKHQADRDLERDPLASRDHAARRGVSLYLALAARYYRSRLTAADDADVLETHCRQIDALARADRYLAGNVNPSLVYQQLALSL